MNDVLTDVSHARRASRFAIVEAAGHGPLQHCIVERVVDQLFHTTTRSPRSCSARVLRRVHREAGPAGSQHEARVRHLPRGHEPHHVHAPVRRRAASRTPNVPECGRPHARSTCSATRDRHGRSTACSPQARRTVRFHGWYCTISRPLVLFVSAAPACPPPSGTTWSCPVSVVYFARRAHQQRALAAGDVHRAEQR